MHKAVKAINRQTTKQHNKLMHLENSMVMYGIHSMESLENQTSAVHDMHNSITEIERLFTEELNTAYKWYINAPNTQEYAK